MRVLLLFLVLLLSSFHDHLIEGAPPKAHQSSLWAQRHITSYSLQLTPCRNPEESPLPVTVIINVTSHTVEPPVMPSIESLITQDADIQWSEAMNLPVSFAWPNASCVNRIKHVKILAVDSSRVLEQILLDHKREQWSRALITEYSYTRQAECFCAPSMLNLKTIHVKADRIYIYDKVKMELVENDDGLPLTATDLFDAIQAGINAGRLQSVNVTYDPIYPFPLLVNYITSEEDETVRMRMSDFQEGPMDFPPSGKLSVMFYIFVPVASVVFGVCVFAGITYIVISRKTFFLSKRAPRAAAFSAVPSSDHVTPTPPSVIADPSEDDTSCVLPAQRIFGRAGGDLERINPALDQEMKSIM